MVCVIYEIFNIDYSVYSFSQEYKQVKVRKHGEGIREDVMCCHRFIFIIYHLTSISLRSALSLEIICHSKYLHNPLVALV
jgi:hypothetical protein